MLRSAVRWVGLGCFILAVSGCGTLSTGTGRAVGINPEPNQTVFNPGDASQELAVAQRMIKAGEYSQVIPRLMHVKSKAPDSAAGIEARYFLGLTYYQLGGYRDAQLNFNEYVAKAPEGRYAAVAREYLSKLTDEVSKRYLTQEQLKTKISEAQEKVRQQPEETAHQLELANLCWKAGKYDEAGAIYAPLLAKWPQLASDATIRNRMERAEDGSYHVITPAEAERRAAEASPIAVFNLHSYRSGKMGPWYSAQIKDTTYNVTGQVANRSQGPVKDVQVIVTLYGFGSMIFDTQTVNVGRMQPGETRPFVVHFTNFDNIENVERFDYTVSFQR